MKQKVVVKAAKSVKAVKAAKSVKAVKAAKSVKAVKAVKSVKAVKAMKGVKAVKAMKGVKAVKAVKALIKYKEGIKPPENYTRTNRLYEILAISNSYVYKGKGGNKEVLEVL